MALMLTKKITCPTCGWKGFKGVDTRRLRHLVICPECKTSVDVDLTLSEVALSAVRKQEPIPQPLVFPRIEANAS